MAVQGGWSSGAIVLGKLPVRGRLTTLDNSWERPTVLAVSAGGSCLDIFFSCLSFLLSVISPFFLQLSGL